MTVTTVSQPSHRPRAAQQPARVSVGLLVTLGFLLSLLLSWTQLADVWNRQLFADTDDAMRLVQIRAWLAGQGWYDLVAHRLNPPDGVLLHWSRVVDIAVGGLIRVFARVLPTDRAETLARICFPVALQLGLLTSTVWLGRILAGARAAAPAMALLVASGFMFVQFQPGRIHHEAPQITLLVTMTACLLASLSPGRARLALAAAACLALSLAIGMALLPFLAVLVAIGPLVWVFRPAETRPVLRWFALGLVAFVPALYAAIVPPRLYAAVAGDALSLPHLAGAIVGAAGYALLAALTPRLASLPSRAVTLGVVGAAIATGLAVAFPTCFRDPYAGMDPMLQRLWLSHVTEAEPLVRAIRERPDTFTLVLCPLLAGLIGLAFAVRHTAGLARVRWAAVLALSLAGLAGTFWEIRVATATAPLALLGGVWVVTRVLAWSERQPAAWWGAAAWTAILPFAATAWVLVPTGDGDGASAAALATGRACRVAPALAPLAGLPPGLVFAPIDDGSHILVYTPHTVLAAPYHRDEDGNKRVLEGLMASPSAAEPIVRGSGARYVAFCPGEPEIALVTRLAPDSLGAMLARGSAPDWLVPVPLPGTPYRVFMIR